MSRDSSFSFWTWWNFFCGENRSIGCEWKKILSWKRKQEVASCKRKSDTRPGSRGKNQDTQTGSRMATLAENAWETNGKQTWKTTDTSTSEREEGKRQTAPAEVGYRPSRHNQKNIWQNKKHPNKRRGGGGGGGGGGETRRSETHQLKLEIRHQEAVQVLHFQREIKHPATVKPLHPLLYLGWSEKLEKTCMRIQLSLPWSSTGWWIPSLRSEARNSLPSTSRKELHYAAALGKEVGKTYQELKKPKKKRHVLKRAIPGSILVSWSTGQNNAKHIWKKYGMSFKFMKKCRAQTLTADVPQMLCPWRQCRKHQSSSVKDWPTYSRCKPENSGAQAHQWNRTKWR